MISNPFSNAAKALRTASGTKQTGSKTDGGANAQAIKNARQEVKSLTRAERAEHADKGQSMFRDGLQSSGSSIVDAINTLGGWFDQYIDTRNDLIRGIGR